MRNKSKRILTVLLCLALAVTLVAPALAVGADNAETGNLKVAVISDTHYLSPTMISDTADYKFTLDSDRKLLSESDAILDTMLDNVRADKPDVLLIPGDLTTNGELECHRAVAAKLQKLKADMPELKIYVTNGNHDIRNADGKNFNTADGVAVPATWTEPADFAEVYGFVFNDESVIARFTPAQGNEAGGLSYVARPCEGFTVLALDSCTYSADVTKNGENAAGVGGVISADLEAWALEQIAAANDRGDVVITMMHHGIVPHFSMEPVVLSDFLVNDYKHVATMLADAGVSYVFTGHMHSNDIAAFTSENGNTVYDIETGSIVTYPAPMRMVNFTKADGKLTADIRTISHVSVGSFTNPCTGQTQSIADLTDYSRSLGYDADSVSNVACRLVKNLVKKFVSNNEEIQNWLVNGINAHIDSIVRQVVAIPVDDEHTLIDAANHVYRMHLAGEDNGVYPDWVQNTIDRIDNGEIIGQIMDIVKNEAFCDHADSIRFDTVVTKSVDMALGKAAVKLIDSLGNDKNYVEDNNTVIAVDLPVAEVTPTPEPSQPVDEPENPDTPEQEKPSVVEKAWSNVKKAVKGFWDSIFGR